MTAKHLAIIVGRIDREPPVGKFAIELANELVERGHRVTMLSPVGFADNLNDSVVLRTPGSRSRIAWISLMRYRRWVAKALAEHQPDHAISLLTNLPAETIVPTAGLLSARASDATVERPRLLMRLVACLSWLQPSVALARWFEKQSLASAGLKSVIALSGLMEASLQASAMHEGASIVRAHLPLNESNIEPVQATALREQLARAWGFNPAAYCIVFPFEMPGPGGIEPILRAFKPFVEQGVDAVLLLAGQSRYTHLAWIGQLGLRDRVRFVGRSDRLEEIFAASDLIASPASDDPIGWSVRPALASGKPVLTTTACGLADAAQEQGGTVLPAPVDPQQLLDAIREHHRLWQDGKTALSSPQTPSEPSVADAIESQFDV